MKPYKRYILISILATFALLIVFSGVILFLAIEHAPTVTSVKTIDTDDAIRVKALGKKVINDLMNSEIHPASFFATEDDFNSMFSLTNRSVSRINGLVLISPELFEMLVTIKIPHNPVGDYINIHISVSPSKSGIVIDQVSLGNISMPGSIARHVIAFILNLTLGHNQGGYLLDSVDSVVLTHASINVNMKIMPGLKKRMKKMVKRFGHARDKVAIMGKPETVRVYYAKIIELSKNIPTNKPVSLDHFIGPLFKLARFRGGDHTDENRAVIQAIAMYFGSLQVERMIGRVRTDEMKLHRRQTKNVVLAGRNDLRLHFTISAALEVASKSGIAHAIGEFKELLDAQRRGSGFSFVDLAADRAGVRFAEVATNPSTAGRIQKLLGNNIREDQFFPIIKGLPERLSKEVFELYFGNIESDIYMSLVNSIDACIGQLPVYTDRRGESGSHDCNIASVVPADLL